MIKEIDEAFKEAYKRNVKPIAIQLDAESEIQFFKEISEDPTSKYMLPNERGNYFKGAKIIRTYNMNGGKIDHNSLICIYLFKDFGVHYIKHEIIRIGEVKK